MHTRALVHTGLPWLLPLLLVACGAPSGAAPAAPSRAEQASATPGPSPVMVAAADPTAAPTAVPEATPTPLPPPPPAQPDSRFVSFSGLAPGAYAVHLHRVCSGAQGYHLAYLPYLPVSAAGSGGIAVPSGDFGRGWCVVVYANRALSAVLAYRQI